MMRIRALFALLHTGASIVLAYARQYKHLQDRLFPLLKAFENTQDGSIEAKDLLKIKKIYGFAVVLLFVEPFQRVRGQKLSTNERYTFSLIGAMTGLLDDYFDKFQLPLARIQELSDAASEVKASNQHEALSRLLLQQLAEHSNLNPAYQQARLDVLHWQQESLRQMNDISKAELDQITRAKAGHSALLYASLLNTPCSKAECDMLYELSALIQLANDIFDVYEDTQSGIHTLANTCASIADLQLIFEAYLHHWLEKLAALPYTKSAKRVFYNRINLVIIARVRVCLDQFAALEQQHGHFNPSQFSRKQLICDMEKPSNQLASFGYFMAGFKN